LSAAAKLPLLRSKPLYQNNFFSEYVVAEGDPHSEAVLKSIKALLGFARFALLQNCTNFCWSMALSP
jgi:hypothetical protein